MAAVPIEFSRHADEAMIVGPDPQMLMIIWIGERTGSKVELTFELQGLWDIDTPPPWIGGQGESFQVGSDNVGFCTVSITEILPNKTRIGFELPSPDWLLHRLEAYESSRRLASAS